MAEKEQYEMKNNSFKSLEVEMCLAFSRNRKPLLMEQCEWGEVQKMREQKHHNKIKKGFLGHNKDCGF